MAKINAFHVSLFAEFLAKLKATPEGDGSLLDHSLYLYGSGMGNPNVHDHENLPILVAGGAAAGMKGGRHIRYKEPHAAGQPPPDAARQGRRPPRYVRRQQRQDRRAVRAAVRCMRRASQLIVSVSLHRLRRMAGRASSCWQAGVAPRPLADAAEQGNAALVRTLARCSAPTSTPPQVDGMTALHWAAYRDDVETARLLVRAGANVNAANRYGVTPLSLACTNGNVGLVELLLERRRRPERDASRRRDGADDRGAHGKSRPRRGAARERRQRQRQGTARTDGH